jgi:lysine decarboxylase
VRAPLAEAVDAALAAGLAHYAPPGHKRRPALVGAGPLAADITLLTGVEDQWSSHGLLRAAEAAVARAWHGDFARISVHGSTLANQAALLALARPGGSIVVSRAAHKSVLAGLVLSGLEPVWVMPEVHDERGLILTQRPDRVAAALAAATDPCGVFVVEPSYAGVLSDVPALAAAAHAAKVPLLIDQAWAAHFGFHPGLPQGALQQGADVMITSLHKTLAAFSQGAALVARTQDARADPGRLAAAFDGLCTTSPSAMIQASVDRARAQMETQGAALLDAALRLAVDLRAALAALPGVRVVDDRWVQVGGVGGWDPLKLVIEVSESGHDGRVLARRLRAAGVQLAMADSDHLIALLSIGDDARAHARLVAALRDALAAPPQTAPAAPPPRWRGGLPEAVLTPREAFFRPSRMVPVERAAGEVSAETIAAYPPGIAEVAPGERLDRERLDYLRALAAAGVRIVGCADPTLAGVRVLSASP